MREQIGVKSIKLQLADFKEALTFDALFVPIRLVNEFHGYNDSLRILPVVFHYDADALLSLVDRSGIEAIGLVTAEEETIPIIINELKFLMTFEGAFVAGATYGRSLPLFVLNIDLLSFTPASARD